MLQSLKRLLIVSLKGMISRLRSGEFTKIL
jgi:hypothetical protein